MSFLDHPPLPPPLQPEVATVASLDASPVGSIVLWAPREPDARVEVYVKEAGGWRLQGYSGVSLVPPESFFKASADVALYRTAPPPAPAPTPENYDELSPACRIALFPSGGGRTIRYVGATPGRPYCPYIILQYEAPLMPPSPSMPPSRYDIQQAPVGTVFRPSPGGVAYTKSGTNVWANNRNGASFSDAQVAVWLRANSVLQPPASTADILSALDNNNRPPRPQEPSMANNNNPDLSSSASATLDMLKEATTTGLKAGLASELAERLVETIENRFGAYPLYPSTLKTPLGRRGLSYAAPVLLYFLASAFPERLPVSPEGVKAAARYAVIGHSVKVIAPLFALLTPLWDELASFAKTELREVKS